MYFQEYLPKQELSKYIDSYFVMNTNDVYENITDLVVPDGTCGMLFIDTQKSVQRNLDIKSPPVALKRTAVFGQKTKPVNYYYTKGNESSFES